MSNIVGGIFALAFLATTASGASNSSAEPVSINVTAPPLGFPRRLEQSWGGASPWFPAEIYEPPPSECEITQVVLLQRHGARYPVSPLGGEMQQSLQQLQQAASFNNPNLTFVKDFQYNLGLNDLVKFGAQQSFDTGEIDYTRYSSLVNATMLPFIRASGSERIVQSAWNWSAGFAYASKHDYFSPLSVIISESSNDTLDTNLCPADGSSTNQTNAWQNVFAPDIVTRLNAEAPGANLTTSDIVPLMSFCPFETVYIEAPSPWCDLFNATEWAAYAYYNDLSYYYYTGYGQLLGPVQGVGWVNELIARLTDQPVQDETQTNHTLDDNPATFPLNRTIYADFTHDVDLIAVFSAIGLFRQPEPLDPVRPDPKRTWVSSRMVPFSGRFVTEKLWCNSADKQGEYVRMLVNDALQPLDFCGASGDGLCTVSSFVESQSFSRNNGDGLWQLCSE